MNSTLLFKKFQEWSETNQAEHKISYVTFVGRMLMFSSLGLALGLVTEKLIVAVQGRQDTNQFKCGGYFALQICALASIFFLILSFGRYFDDWLWNTFAGSFFALCFFNSQTRLVGNINCAFKLT
jgi:hypothetical protein